MQPATVYDPRLAQRHLQSSETSILRPYFLELGCPTSTLARTSVQILLHKGMLDCHVMLTHCAGVDHHEQLCLMSQQAS